MAHRRLAALALVGAGVAVSLAACALDVSGVDGAASRGGAAGAGDDASLGADGTLGSSGDDASSAGDDGATASDAPTLTCTDGSMPCSGACVDTTANLQHCGSCSVACPGGDASCGAGVCAATLRVRGYLDDQSSLVLKGNQLHWEETKGAAPGRWQGADEPTYVDYVPWSPTWPAAGENRDCNCMSSALTVTPLAAKAQDVTVTVVEGRSKVTIGQQPDATNDYTLVIDVEDSPGGADWYELLLGYQTD